MLSRVEYLAVRQGKIGGVITGEVGQRILVIAYHVLQTCTPYQELGSAYFERRNGDRQRKRLIRQLESLGLKVTVEEIKEAA